MPNFKDRVKELTTTSGTGTLTLSGAVLGFQALGASDNGKAFFCVIAHRTAAEWEVFIGTYTHAGRTLTRSRVISSSNSGSAVTFSAGNKDVTVDVPAEQLLEAAGYYGDLPGRLSLESGVPVSITDQAAKSNLYFVPTKKGSRVKLYYQDRWQWFEFTAQVTLALSGMTGGKNYDVYLYWSGSALTLELGAAWTNDSTRATARDTQDGYYVKGSDPTRLYLGYIRASAATTTEDTVTQRFVSNFFNRVARRLFVCPGYTDANDYTSYTTTSTTFTQVNGGAGGTVKWLSDGETPFELKMYVLGTQGADSMRIGMGIDSTTSPEAAAFLTGSGINAPCGINRPIAEGYHTADMLVTNVTAATATLFSDQPRNGAAADPRTTYMEGWVAA